MAELRHIVVSGGPFAAFQISIFSFCGLVVGWSFPKFNRSFGGRTGFSATAWLGCVPDMKTG